jgi:uridine kinase
MIIGICGGTGSGKTTIARRIIESVGKESVILIESRRYAA